LEDFVAFEDLFFVVDRWGLFFSFLEKVLLLAFKAF
jgi:hypothetical protein